MSIQSLFKKNKISIIILNYNGTSKNIKCLDSIYQQNHTNFNIVFIDNNSTDNSVELVTKYCIIKTINFIIIETNNIPETNFQQDFFILKNEYNKGYSYGNNVGIQFVKSYLNEVSNILILNNDVIIPTNFLSELTNRFLDLKKNLGTNKIALGAPELTMTNKKNHSGLHYLNLLSGLAFNFPVPPYYKYLVGASIFLDNNPPSLDEKYFLYFDDVEYSRILKNNNYRLELLNDCYYQHDQGYSTKSLNNLTGISYTSMKFFYKKHYPFYIPFVFLIRFVVNLLKSNLKNNRLLIEVFIFDYNFKK